MRKVLEQDVYKRQVIDRVFADQRGLIEKYVDKDVTKVPQVFIPYKEVLDIYHAGLQVPDDVTLMWCCLLYTSLHLQEFFSGPAWA